MLIKGVPLNIAALGEVLTRRVENKTSRQLFDLKFYFCVCM